MTRVKAEGGAYDMFCTTEWIYYRTQTLSSSYHYFKSDLSTYVEVSKIEFDRAKYQANITPYEDGEEVVFMPNGDTIRCFFQGSIVRVFSPSGKLVRELPDSIAKDSIYSIALDQNGHLWTAEPTFHRIGQYELETGRMLFELGGNPNHETGELDHPEDISIYDNYAFISDMGNRRIVILNTTSKHFGTYCNFDQPVWQYRRFKNHELVRLQDGLYIL